MTVADRAHFRRHCRRRRRLVIQHFSSGVMTTNHRNNILYYIKKQISQYQFTQLVITLLLHNQFSLDGKTV